MPRIAIPESAASAMITEEEAASLIGVERGELKRSRLRGEVPRGVFWVVGQRRVRYSRAKLLAWRDAGGNAGEPQPVTPRAA